MKIKRVRCENFRQFKDPVTIEFDTTPGKINIVYGFNGTGKTTLHQLFQWVFYGKVNFSHDVSKVLYNVAYVETLPLNKQFDVVGSILYYDEIFKTNFELTRRTTFKKELLGVRTVKSDAVLMYQKANKDWVTSNKSYVEFLNKSLPEKLSHYFFFDGERMVNDFISQKNSNSIEEETLKKTIYNIFQLDTYENAIKHLGVESDPSSVIGKLSTSIPKSSLTVEKLKREYEEASSKCDGLSKKIADGEQAIDSLKKEANSISESIGGIKSLEEVEKMRKALQETRNKSKLLIDSARKNICTQITNTYPLLLLANRIIEAKEDLGMQISKSELPTGLNKNLIDYLLKQNTCICGSPLTQKEKDTLESWLMMLPPHSLKIIYDDFVKRASENLSTSTESMKKIDRLMVDFINSIENYQDFDDQLEGKDFDLLKKAAEDIQPLIVKRSELEKTIEATIRQVSVLRRAYVEADHEKKVAKNRFDSALEKEGYYNKVKEKVDLLIEVKNELINEFNVGVSRYSKSLSRNIDLLLVKMFNGERMASLDETFKLHVYDDYGNESMSEGQFAVVTFAYIGGILSSLREYKIDKLFPLVLDGPFSKLDKTHIKNVVDALPSFANQIIIFSKDNLDSYISDEIVGSVYSIESNSQRNIATVRGLK